MRKIIHQVLKHNRIRDGKIGTDDSDGNNGAFIFQSDGVVLRAIASTAEWPEAKGWEHVSVSCQDRTPTWSEMCFIKLLFWGEEECMVQFHPPQSEYINCHPYCLHMWKNTREEQKLPPSILVGPKKAIA